MEKYRTVLQLRDKWPGKRLAFVVSHPDLDASCDQFSEWMMVKTIATLIEHMAFAVLKCAPPLFAYIFSFIKV